MNYTGISKNPRDRISVAMRQKVDRHDTLFDIHCHCFSVDDVPDGFFGIRLPLGKELTEVGAKLFHKFYPYSDEDVFSNWSYFLNVIEMAPEEILSKLLSYYPENAILTPLMMDFQPAAGCGIKGAMKHDFYIQRAIMMALQKIFPDTLLPFLAIDPRRERVGEIFRKSIFEDGFFGIKMYPSLGFLPSHPVLMEEIYPLCEEYNIPITAHSGPATVHTSYHLVKDIRGKKHNWHNEWVDVHEDRWFWKERDYSYYFNSPVEWEPVLEQFPKLRLNLAHFGGDREWVSFLHSRKNTWPSRIFTLMEKYENVYADISYIFFNIPAITALKHILSENRGICQKTLFGSDFYLIAVEGHFRSFYSDCRILLGDDIFRAISHINPKRFLGLMKGDLLEEIEGGFSVNMVDTKELLEKEKEFIEKAIHMAHYSSHPHKN